MTLDARLAGGVDVIEVDAILRDAGNPTRPVLVGHDPDFSALVRRCARPQRGDAKGALARIDVERPIGAGRGDLRWLLRPTSSSPAELVGRNRERQRDRVGSQAAATLRVEAVQAQVGDVDQRPSSRAAARSTATRATAGPHIIPCPPARRPSRPRSRAIREERRTQDRQMVGRVVDRRHQISRSRDLGSAARTPRAAPASARRYAQSI